MPAQRQAVSRAAGRRREGDSRRQARPLLGKLRAADLKWHQGARMRQESVALRRCGAQRKAVAVCRVNRTQVTTAPAVSAAQRGWAAELIV